MGDQRRAWLTGGLSVVLIFSAIGGPLRAQSVQSPDEGFDSQVTGPPIFADDQADAQSDDERIEPVPRIGQRPIVQDGDLTEEQLLEYLYRVKEALPDIPVGYVDAYYEFSHRPKITEACDVILTNCYPYWEGCPIEYSLHHMQSMFGSAKDAGKGKRVIITETGWPSEGGSLKAAVASNENAMKYFIETQLWSQQNDIEIFYFSSFDESWKVGAEGDVGAYWGLWDKNEKLKF